MRHLAFARQTSLAGLRAGLRDKTKRLGPRRHDLLVDTDQVLPRWALPRREEAEDRESPFVRRVLYVARYARNDELHLSAIATERQHASAPHVEAALHEWNGALVAALVAAVDKRAERGG